LAISDFIVLAAPATTETTRRFDRQAFERMNPSAALVNISRGALIVDQDLVAALDAGRLSGYATDVFRQEPPAPDDPLLDHPKIVVSPHVAWGTTDSVERLLDVSIDNVEAFLSGRPIHVVAN
jgi:glycerate dehydrogenase